MSVRAGPSVSVTLHRVACPLCDHRQERTERWIRGFRLARCRVCGMVFVDPQPTSEAVAAGYSGDADVKPVPSTCGTGFQPVRTQVENPCHKTCHKTLQDRPLAELIGGRPDKIDFYETWFGPRDRPRWAAALEKMARLVGRGRLLEYGCGPALVGQLAAEQGWRVEAIDIGEWVRELQPQRGFPLHVGTLAEQRWVDGRFDAVYAQDVLEHLQRPLEELRELARLLRPGGVLYVHVPNYASLTIRLGVSRFAYNEPLGHLNYFTPRTLTRMLHAAGFDRVQLRSDHLEYQDFFRRGPFDYQAFEQRLSATGRRDAGAAWSIARALLNLPLNLFRCGTYLWGFARRGSENSKRARADVRVHPGSRVATRRTTATLTGASLPEPGKLLATRKTG